mgnify:FL=1
MLKSELEKIKPCPFCGNNNIIIERRRDGNVVSCIGCGVSIVAYISREEIIEMWNRRVNEKI